MKGKIVIVLNSTWNLVNFRSGLIKALLSQGYQVVAVAPSDEYTSKLEALGCRFVPIPIDNKGLHPGRDLLLFCRLLRLLHNEKPDLYLGYTIKPNIYGSLAAHILGIPVINNVAGLGTVFMSENWLTHLVSALYRLAFLQSAKIFFQNNDDRQMFILRGLVSQSVTECLPGSGIDLVKFAPTPLPVHSCCRFILIGRMLWSKGVGEFVEAARLLKKRDVDAEFYLLGFLDVKNPAAISRTTIDEWVREGVITYLGATDNVWDEIVKVDCVVLPSFYGEGTPRALLEAAASARPIITTNSVGCRDVIDDGFSGYLCKPRDAFDLADKMAHIVAMSPQKREAMGMCGRHKAELEFDEQIVIRRYLEVIHEALLVRSCQARDGRH